MSGFLITEAGIFLGLGVGILVVILFYQGNYINSFMGRVSRNANQICAWVQLTINKITWRDYFESNLRATTGKPLERPFGSSNHYFFGIEYFLTRIF